MSADAAPEPLVVMVRRYECPFCKRRRASKASTVEHIGLCWHDPENRACKTCQHHYIDEGEWEVGIAPEEGCGVGVKPERFPTSNCPMWEDKG